MSTPTIAGDDNEVGRTIAGGTPDGSTVDLYSLRSVGIRVTVMTFGARIVSIETPDRDGKNASVTLGYRRLDSYLADESSYLGAVVGRYVSDGHEQ